MRSVAIEAHVAWSRCFQLLKRLRPDILPSREYSWGMPRLSLRRIVLCVCIPATPIPATEVPLAAEAPVEESAAEESAAEEAAPTEEPAPTEVPAADPAAEEAVAEEAPAQEPAPTEVPAAPAEPVATATAVPPAPTATAAPLPTATPLPAPTATAVPAPTPVPPPPAVNVPELNGAFSTIGGGQIDLGSLQGQDANTSEMEGFISRHGAGNMQHIADADPIWSRFGVRQQRTYILINDDGTVRQTGYGNLENDVIGLINN